MASKKQGKTQEQIIAGFQELRQQQRQINAKVSDIEMDMKEHEYDFVVFIIRPSCELANNYGYTQTANSLFQHNVFLPDYCL